MIRRPVLAFVLAAVLGALAAPSPAQAPRRTVDCRVESGGAAVFAGKCAFVMGERGSFSLLNLERDRPLYRGMIAVSLEIVSTGVGDVRGLTTDGINSRWGEARRSTQDPACWVGSDFRICAR
jgi:hypothetical protein